MADPISSADMEAEEAAFVRDLWCGGAVDPAELHPFPMDRGRSLEAARAAGFASAAPVEGEGSEAEAPEEPAAEREPEPAPVIPAASPTPSVTVNIKLAAPLRVAGKMLRQITVREPTMNEIGQWIAGGLRDVDLTALMTGHPPEVLAALAWTDSERVVRAVHWFLPASG